jgi:hypothetical protein
MIQSRILMGRLMVLHHSGDTNVITRILSRGAGGLTGEGSTVVLEGEARGMHFRDSYRMLKKRRKQILP